jgi:hypothetical protein
VLRRAAGGAQGMRGRHSDERARNLQPPWVDAAC